MLPLIFSFGVCVMFIQVSVGLLILFTSFVLQVHFNPYLPSGKISKHNLVDNADTEQVISADKIMLKYRFNYNFLESSYLICSILLLLSGLVFESASTERYESARQIVAVFVMLMISLALVLFVCVISIELYRSLQFAKKISNRAKVSTYSIKISMLPKGLQKLVGRNEYSKRVYPALRRMASRSIGSNAEEKGQ